MGTSFPGYAIYFAFCVCAVVLPVMSSLIQTSKSEPTYGFLPGKLNCLVPHNVAKNPAVLAGMLRFYLNPFLRNMSVTVYL